MGTRPTKFGYLKTIPKNISFSEVHIEKVGKYFPDDAFSDVVVRALDMMIVSIEGDISLKWRDHCDFSGGLRKVDESMQQYCSRLLGGVSCFRVMNLEQIDENDDLCYHRLALLIEEVYYNKKVANASLV